MTGGDMTYFGTAAKDPIFVLHHSNIGRYWECWLALPRRGHVNADSPYTEQTFLFNTLGSPRCRRNAVRRGRLGGRNDALTIRSRLRS
jgi:hypothetical protein